MNIELRTYNFEQSSEVIKDQPVVRKRWRDSLFIAAMVLSFASSAFAMGGDYVTPFPVSDPLPAKQEAKAMAVDSVGNIIVAGYTNVGGMNNDYQVTKFKADGSGVAWRATFDKAGGDDQAAAVVVDGSNNVIVTGTVWNGSNKRIHTIKYASDGALLWQHTWSGAAGADIATSIAVDGTNNIYVAGYSVNNSGNDDYLILKYPSAGSTPEWQEVWNSSFNSNDRIMSIAAGVDGIVVTGASSKGGTDFDILTRKYGFDKSLVWEQRKASTANGDDRGVAVKMDPSGNVIVTGYLYNGANNDMYTVKYSSASPGTLLWENVYAGSGNDEPRALWVDGADDVYVTGYTYTFSGNEDFYTVRYKGSDGTKLWDAIYNSGSDFTDIPVGLVVKNGVDGDLFVVGYTTTNINENITTLKYRKSTGALLWQRSFNGGANKNERPVGIGLTTTGDVCIAGWTDTATNSYDYLVLKYDFGVLNPPTGLTATSASNTAVSLAWQDNSPNGSGFKVERKLGESEPVYTQIGITGPGVTSFNDTGLDSNSYYYYRVRSYNSADGDSSYSNEAHALTKVVSYDAPAWVYRYNGDDNREDEAVGITVGSDDHPIVTGFSDLTEEGVEDAYSFDYMTIKLDRADKSVLWKARYDSGDGGTDMAAGIVLDTNGDAIVTGTAYLSGGSEKSDDLYTIKYSSANHTDPNSNPPFAWGEQYGTQAGIDQATAIQTVKDSSNSVVVIGHGTNTANNEDMFILKYSADGTRPWPPIVFDGGNDGNDYPSAVALDASGNIFITGSTENAAGNFDIYTAKYNGATGVPIWSQIYAGAGNGDDHGLSLSVDRKGDVYVTGYAVNSAGNEEWVTIKYDGADNSVNREIWKKVYNGPAAPVNGNDRGISVAIDPVDGSVVVAGTAYVSLTDSDFHLIRYNAADGSVIWERNFDRPETYDYLTAMAIDSSGYIYMTGNSRSGPDTDPGFDASAYILSLIYDYEGTFLSATTYNGGFGDEARAIAVNYQGESFTAGVTHNSQNPDYLVVKQKNNYILVPAPFQLLPQADAGKINLTWRSNSPGTSFRVERTLGPILPGSIWSLLTTAAPGITGVLDSGLDPGTNYCYRIYAFSGSLNSRTIESCVSTTLVAPTLNTLAVDSASQITLSWSQVPGNNGFRIERKVGAESWSDLSIKATDQTTHSDTGLTPGTTYSYRVSTNNASGYSIPGNEQSAPTLPAAPSMAANGIVTINSVMLNWTNVAGETGYRVDRKQGAEGEWGEIGTTITDVITYTDIGLAANTQYYYRVRAFNASGNSTYSGEQGALSRFFSSTLSYATGSAIDKVDLSWSNVPGNNGYTVQYVACNQNSAANAATYCPNLAYYGAWSNLASVGTDVTSYQVPLLSAGSAYQFRVVTNTTGNSSEPSNQIIAWTYMTGPSVTVSPVSETSLNVSWGDIAGETNYTLERKQGAGGTWAEVAGAIGMDVNTVSKSDVGLALSTEYCYRVKAYSTNANGPPVVYSNEPCLLTPLAAPVLSDPSVISSIQINISWANIPGNTGYEILRCNSNFPNYPEYVGYYGNDPGNDYWFWSCNPVVAIPQDSVSYMDTTGLQPGYTYRYKIRDIYPGGASSFSAPKDAITNPSAPALSAAAASTTQMNVSWTDVYGDSGFKLELKPRTGADCTAGTWSDPILLGENTTTYQHSGLATGTFYCYRIKAYNANGVSEYSNEFSQATQLDPPTLDLLTGVTTTQIVLSWSSVAGNSGYTIESKMTEVGGWGTTYTTATDISTYTDTGLTPGILYFYRVRTNNAGGSSLSSNEQSSTTTPVAPAVTATTVSASRIDLSWPVVIGATNYRIAQKEGSGSYGEPTNLVLSYSESYCGNSYPTIGCPSLSPDSTAYQNTGLTENTTYCYQLTAWNSTGGDSALSIEKCIATLPVADLTLTATPLNAFKIRLEWAKMTCASCVEPEGFEIERLVRDGNWVKIATVGTAATTYIDKIAIDPIKRYRYRIRSYIGGSKSPYSEAVTYTPPYTPGDNVN